MILALLVLQATAPSQAVIAAPHAARVAQLCGARSPADAGQLLALERREADVASRRPSTSDWVALGCTRAQLEFAGVVGREGVEMPLGDPWALGAINAMSRAVAAEPAHPVAAEVMALMALAEEADDVAPGVIASVLQASQHALAPTAMLRACSEFALRVRDTVVAGRCAHAGLARGADSTWHLIRRARIAFSRADTAGGSIAFAAAASSARGAAAHAELDWHLRWFLSPDEYQQWKVLPDSSASGFVRDRLTTRDVRDARPFGARLVEHFARLDVVLQRFRLHLARQFRERGGFPRPTPEGLVDAPWQEVLTSCEPGTIPAESHRFYDRWQWVIDDRGAVWMRFGPPDDRIDISPQCPGALPGSVVREMWRYMIDGEAVLLHFENEAFDGSASAARLVAGVLGTYMCDLDAARCTMSHRTSMPGGLPPEQLERVRVQDDAYLVTATTTDDNAPRGLATLRVAARLHRLRDPQTDRPIALVSYALRMSDLERDGAGSAAVTLTIRWWDPRAAVERDTALIRVHAIPAGADTTRSLTGFVVLPGSDGIAAWSIAASQPERFGRSGGIDEPPLAEGAVRMSNIVVGSAASGLVWRWYGEELLVTAVGRAARTHPVTLYYQVESGRARDSVFTSITLTRLRGSVASPRPDLDIRMPSSLVMGLNEFVPELDVSLLEPGHYRIDLAIAVGRDAPFARRSTTITLD